MGYVVFSRVNGMAGKGRLVVITTGDDEFDTPAEFDTYAEAQETAERLPACVAWGYDVVEVG